MTRWLEQTLDTLEHLPTEELDALVAHALKLRASRNAPHLGKEETQVLEQIHHAIPTNLQTRFDHLLEKRDAFTITEAEHAELLELTDVIENLEARRVTLLGDLARYRGVGLEQVMRDLGINAPTVNHS